MVAIRVMLPAVLTVVLKRKFLDVEADTLAGALDAAYAECPALRAVLCDESGAFREHVLCLLETSAGTQNTRWMPNLERPLIAGERIVIMQAVSGG